MNPMIERRLLVGKILRGKTGPTEGAGSMAETGPMIYGELILNVSSGEARLELETKAKDREEAISKVEADLKIGRDSIGTKIQNVEVGP